MSTANEIDRESHKDPATLEREIDQQRADITNIVHALEDKLSPGQMIDTALGYAKGNGGEFLTNLGNTLKANPVPTLLTGIGLAWLMAGQNRQPRPYAATTTSTGPGMRERLGEKSAALREQGAGVKARAGEMRTNVSTSIGNARTRLSDGSRHLSNSARHRAEQARGGFNRMLEEQPLALGAIGIALGALVAAAVPPTRREDELMGHTRDDLAERAKVKAQAGYDKASTMGRDVADQVKHDMSHERSNDGMGTSQAAASRPH